MDVQNILMKCGHTALATYDDKPVCPICNCHEIAETKPDLTGRTAKCFYCGKEQPSGNLPFFKYQPEQEFDSYYCGCEGWD